MEDDAPLFSQDKPKTTLTQKQKGMKGMIYMAIAAVFYSLMAFLLKLLYLHSTITAYEVTYWQSIFMVFANYIWMKALKRDPF